MNIHSMLQLVHKTVMIIKVIMNPNTLYECLISIPVLKNLIFYHITDQMKNKEEEEERDAAARNSNSYNGDAVPVEWYILAKLKNKRRSLLSPQPPQPLNPAL